MLTSPPRPTDFGKSTECGGKKFTATLLVALALAECAARNEDDVRMAGLSDKSTRAPTSLMGYSQPTCFTLTCVCEEAQPAYAIPAGNGLLACQRHRRKLSKYPAVSSVVCSTMGQTPELDRIITNAAPLRRRS